MYQTEVDRLLNFSVPNRQSCNVNDIEQYNNILTNALHMSANAYIPFGKFRPFLKPYWKENNLDKLHFEQREARRVWKNNDKPREQDNRFHKNYKDKKREFRKRKRQAQKRWNEEKYEDFRNAAEVDIGEFYKCVRKARNKDPMSNKLIYDGKEATLPGDVCELWGSYFENLYSEKEEEYFDKIFSKHISEIVKHKREHNNMDNISILEDKITIDEIEKQVQTLKARKSPGQDKISNEHIIYGGRNLQKHLCSIYNLILEKEYIPTSYRHGIVIPLYKGNNKEKTDPNSYRAVSLTSSLGKLFDKIILNRMQTFLTANDLVLPHPLQFGFVKDHGAIPAIYSLKEAINYYLERDSTVYATFLDNEKAFDKVWQDGLLYKLHKIGIQGRLWSIIYMSYKTATAHVQYNGVTSQCFRIQQGVGQGRVMSAWFFAVFINDLILELLSTNSGLIVGTIKMPSILLADDTTLLSSSVNGTQTLLNCVYKYSTKWRLKYNATKSCLLVFKPTKTTKCADATPELKLGNINIEKKQRITYAGTLIDSSNKTLFRTEAAGKKMKQKLHSLYSVGMNPRGMSALTNTIIWKRIILPTALYSCETWGPISPREHEILEVSQRYFAKFILQFHKRSPSVACVSNLGLWTVMGYIEKIKLLFLGRLCRAFSGHTHKQLFNLRLSQVLTNTCSSNSITHELLKLAAKYDLQAFMEEYLLSGFFPNKILWKKIVIQTIDIYEEKQWRQAVECRNELKRYCLIQTCLTEHRLLRLAQLFPYFNTGCMTLVKLGCTPSKSGHCVQCSEYTDDLLKHYILSCPALLDIRSEMFYKVVDILSVTESIDYFNQDDDELVNSVLGGMTDVIRSLQSDTWGRLMCHIAEHMHRMHSKFACDLYNQVYYISV